MGLAAIIFDFDGVLADTEELHCAAFQVVAAEVGVHLAREDYYRAYLGLPDRECFAALCVAGSVTISPSGLDKLVNRKRREFARRAQDAGLYPGVAPIIERLHARFALAVASGAFRDEIETVLTRAHVRELFAVVVGAEDVRAGKPAPDPFLHALREINRHTGQRLAPAQCVVIEDSPRGITAARAAGMRCIAVATSHERAELGGADVIIGHVRDLRDADLEP